MSVSPVRSVTDFERLKGQLENAHSAERRLRLLLDFWPVIQGVRSNQTFAGFVQEYVGLVSNTLTKNALSDATARQLEHLEAQISEICDAGLDSAKLRLVRERKAWALLYLGETEAGISALAAAREEADSESVVQTIPDQLSEIERLQFVHDNIGQGALKDGLRAILSEWQLEREAAFHDRAICVFVEKGNDNGNGHGKIRTLKGRIEPGSRSAPNDEVTFDNQIKTPQDPFVGSAYSALEAVRSYFAATGNARLAQSRFHAHLNIEDSGETFTGDSIGLAIALLGFTQLLQPEAARHDRFLSAEVAYTGAVAEDGRVLPVSQESIGAKVERAFHSQVRFLVLPQANYAAARSRLDQLELQYPHRSLSLVPVRHLTDCLNDHNIVRSEKVCIGEFVARKAVKYSRMTKVQVPLLVVLGYLMLAVISPKTFWPWFDRNPLTLEIIGNRIEALNQKGQFLWSHEFPDALTDEDATWTLASVDDDAENEVIILPSHRGISRVGGMLHVFDHNGDSLFARDCVIRGEYPGDTLPSGSLMPLQEGLVATGIYRGERLIITSQTADSPARSYVCFWDLKGRRIGSYINSGYAYFCFFGDLDRDGTEEAVFAATNNRLASPAILVLDPASADGVSPPYGLHGKIDLRNVKRGTQKHYVLLGSSDLHKFTSGSEYSSIVEMKKVGESLIQVQTDELREKGYPIGLCYIVDGHFELVDARYDDVGKKRLEQLIDSKRLPNLPLETYEDTAANRVSYFIDGQFVTEGQRRARKLLLDIDR